MCTFQEVTLHKYLNNQNLGHQKPKYSKRNTQIKTNRKRNPKRSVWTTAKCNQCQSFQHLQRQQYKL